MSAPDVPKSVLVAALKQIQRRGDLVEFVHPESGIPAVFSALCGERLIVRRKKAVGFDLTDAGYEYLRGRS